MRKAEFVAGSRIDGGESQMDKRLLDKIEKELKTDFDPELYDRAMERMFDDRYYEAEDQDAEKSAKSKSINMKLMKDKEIEGVDDEEMKDEV